MKNFWKAGIAAFVLLAIAGTAAGIVAAQTGGSTPDATSTAEPTATGKDATSTPKSGADATPSEKDTVRDEFLNDLAGRLGVSRAQLDEALKGSALAMVDKALADNKITQDEADRIKEKINSGDFPFFGGFRHHGPRGMGFGICAGAKLEDIAGFLGVDASVVRDGLMNDQSLAQIAEAHGKSRDELKAFLIDNVTTKLNDAVKNQDITQKRADEALQNFKDHADDLIDHQGAPFRGGPRFHDGFPGDKEDGQHNGTPETETSSLTL